MQLRRPEATGHHAALGIEITALQQVDFPLATALLVGKCFNGFGHAQWHMCGTSARIDAISVGVFGGYEHEQRLAVEIPREH